MNMEASIPSLIGIDWGTTSLRAYLIDAQGNILDSLSTSDGILQVTSKDFSSLLVRLLEPWLTMANLPMIASGMITSRNGWFETAYLPLPVNCDQLANALEMRRIANGLDIHFVTGATTMHNGAPDVMRGEETQIVGTIQSGLTDGVFVMPGTHSKWVTVRKGQLEDFSTFMSGEIFAALRGHTILGAFMSDDDFSQRGFEQGVAEGFDAGTQLLHRLFHVRTMPLFGLIGEEDVSDYLSGMLIGAEISGALNKGVGENQVTIVGNNSLTNRYAIALDALGQSINLADDDIAASGHFAIAKSAGLV